MYDMKALHEAKSVADAVRLLQEYPQAQIIAGGSDVLVQMREGKRAGAELVSIYGLDELRGVTMEEDGTIRIGSLTSFSHITKDPIIQKYLSVLGEAVDMVGGPQIRNIGTIGGNTCNGVTSADSASTLFAWDAVIELTGPEGIRRVPIKDFYIKAGKVDLRPGEIQTGILIPRKAYEGYEGYYIKYAMRNAMDIATLGCSVNVKLSDDKKTFTDVRIAYGVAGPVPMRAVHTEAAGRGLEVTEENIEKIGDTVLEDVTPRDSWRASKAFREHISKVLCKRALKEAVRRAGGMTAEEAANAVADAVAALTYYPVPLVIVDMGTATTVSVVDEKKRYLGGMILPGVRVSLDALTSRASQLSGISIEEPKRLIGKNTVDCMKSGILYGNAAAVDGIIDRIEEELGQKVTAIATGGMSKKIIPHCRREIIQDEDLLLKGLLVIYEKNK